RETITESLKQANILKMNLHEAHYLAELFEISLSSLPDFCAEMMEDWSLSCCLVTLGGHGAFTASADGKKVYVPGYEIKVVDTCGSGDARSEEHTSELQSRSDLVCRLLLEKKKRQ